MWSTAFTSSRSHFVETARVGIQAEPPSQARSKASEAAVAEALRLALGDNSKFRLILVDRGAEGSVRTVLRPEEIVVDEDSPLAPKDPPPPRSELVVVARLGGDCHRTSDACVVQTRRILDGLGVAKLDGLCVPWPAALGDGGNDPYHVSADVKRQKRLFLRTWKNLQPLVEAGSVRWLGTEMLETWQLERLIEAVAPEQRPVFNLVSLNLVEPRRRTVTWCQSRGIEVLALLDTTLNKLRAGVEKETFKTLQGALGLDEATIILRWALQRGVVAFPTLRRVIDEGSALTSAKKYEAWVAKLQGILRARTLHIHSPTEERRVHLSVESLATLATLDREYNDKERRYNEMIAAKTKAKLKPMRTAAKAIQGMNAFAGGVSKLLVKAPAEDDEEKEMESAF